MLSGYLLALGAAHTQKLGVDLRAGAKRRAKSKPRKSKQRHHKQKEESRALPQEVYDLLQPVVQTNPDFFYVDESDVTAALDSIRNKYVLDNFIAAGTYGFVWKAHTKSGGNDVAIKFVVNKEQDTPTDQDRTNQLQLAKKGVTVPVYDWFQKDKWAVIVMGFARNMQRQDWTFKRVQQALSQIKKMYDMSIMCTDLKPANTVLFNSFCELDQFDENALIIVRGYRKQWARGMHTLEQQWRRHKRDPEPTMYPEIPYKLRTMLFIFLANLSYAEQEMRSHMDEFVRTHYCNDSFCTISGGGRSKKRRRVSAAASAAASASASAKASAAARASAAAKAAAKAAASASASAKAV
jgi:hypothetical protein